MATIGAASSSRRNVVVKRQRDRSGKLSLECLEGRNLLAVASLSTELASAAALSSAAIPSGVYAPQVVHPLLTGYDVQVRLEAEDSSGVAITTIAAGQSFQLACFVKDVSTTDTSGVYSTYDNVTYNSALASISPSATISYVGDYDNGETPGSTALTTPGQINDVGAFYANSTLGNSGTAEYEVWTVPVTATAAGTLTFTATSADPNPGPLGVDPNAAYATYLFNKDTTNGGETPGEIHFLTASVTVTSTSAAVVGQSLFYHDSFFDGFNTTTNANANVASDGAAIATDKSALLPGGTATFANYSSYTQGINGIMVDIAGSNYPAGQLSAATIASDFTFATGNSNVVGSFTAATAPASVTVLKAGGANGADRLEMIWSAGTAVAKGWLEVTINPSLGNNLPSGSPYTFYFGSDSGNTGTSANPIKVGNFVGSAADELNTKGHFAAKGTAAITDIYDFNRDGQVNSLDQLIARAGETNKLAVITPPAAPTVLGQVTPLAAQSPAPSSAQTSEQVPLETIVSQRYAGQLDDDLLRKLAASRK